MASFGIKRSVLGAIITLSCTWVFSYASFPFPPHNMNLMAIPQSEDYSLDAKENTSLFLGQVAVFTCSDVERLGSITRWLKDGKEVATSELLSKETMENLFWQKELRDKIGFRPKRVPTFFPLNEDAINSNTTSSEYTVLIYGRLYIHNLTKSHEGKYSCLIEDFHGKILRRQFDVTVIDAPKCSLQRSMKRYLYRHSNTRLQCALNFKNIFTRHWKKNGEDIIANGFSEKFNSLENGALHIFNLSSEDSGNYTCHVKTPLGWISCGPVELDVSDEDISLYVSEVYKPANVTVRPSYDTAELECLVNNINATYGWARPWPDQICGGRICPENRLVHSPRRNILILKKVSTADAGYYECISRVPDERNTEKTTLYLDVLTKPEITVEYRSEVVLPARRIMITCSVGFSNPPAEVYWVKDGVRTDTQKGKGIITELKDNNAFLTIVSAEYTHRGRYQCVANNGVGITSSETYLNIPRGKPPPTPQNLTAVAVSPNEVHVNWVYLNLSAIHSFRIIAEKDHAPLKNEPMEKTVQHYVLSNLQPFTNYTIKVIACARKSTSETAVIRIQTPETIPCGRVEHAIHAISVSPTAILLTWESLPLKDRCGIITLYQVISVFPFDDMSQHLSYVNNNHPTYRGITTEYKIFSDLRPGTEYYFSIIALTREGSGPESPFAITETYQESEKSCMTDGGTVFQYVEGKMDGKQSINVSWALHDNDFVDAIHVSLLSLDGVVKVKKKLGVTETSVVLISQDKQPVYVIRMAVFDIRWDVCETYNFTVQLKDKEVWTKRTSLTIDSVSSMGPHCIYIGWSYNATNECKYVVRYKRFLAAHFQYLNTSAENVTICNLQPWSYYEYGVAILTDSVLMYNELDYTLPDSFIRTEESEPGRPEDLRCGVEENSHVFCAWSPPIIPNGLIRNYTIRYHDLGKENEYDNISTDTQILLECLKPEVSYVFQVWAMNDAGKSAPSISFKVYVPLYDMELNNCSVIMTHDINSPGDQDNSERDDVTFGMIIAMIVLSIGILLGLTLFSICFPDYFRWRLCTRKCLGLAGKNIASNKKISNGKTVNKNDEKPTGVVHLEMLTERNTLLLSDNYEHTNGRTPNGSDCNGAKKSGIHKTSFTHGKPTKPDSRYEDGTAKGWKFFQSKSQKTSTVLENEAADKEQSQHLILSIPNPKHYSVSSDARSSTCTQGSISIDSITEET